MNFKKFLALGALVFSVTVLPYTITVHNNSGKKALVYVEYGQCRPDIVILNTNDTKELGVGPCCSNRIIIYYGDNVQCFGRNFDFLSGKNTQVLISSPGIYKNAVGGECDFEGGAKMFEDTYSHTCTGRTITLKPNSVEVK